GDILIIGKRRIVHRVDRDEHGASRQQRAIVHGEGEAVRAVVVSVRRVSDGAAVGIQNAKSAMYWGAQNGVRDRTFQIAAGQNKVGGSVLRDRDILIIGIGR